MAGVFKSLDKSDVRLTPFRAYKQRSDTISYCNYSASLGTLTNPTHIIVNEKSPSPLLIANSTSYALLDSTDENLENLIGTTSSPVQPILAVKQLKSSTIALLTNDRLVEVNTTTGASTIKSAIATSPQNQTDLAETLTSTYILSTEFGVNQGSLIRFNSSYAVVGTYADSFRMMKVNTDANLRFADDSTNCCAVLMQDNSGGINNGSYIGYMSNLNFNAGGFQKNIITTEVGIQDLLYSTSQQGYYSLINNKLYFTKLSDITATTLVATGIAAILEDRDNNIHAVRQGGDILINIVCDGNSVAYETIAGSNFVGTNTATQAVITSDNLIGILASNVFYIYDINNKQFRNPKHLDGSTNITKIYAGKDVELVSTRIFGIGPNMLMDLTCEPDDFTLYKADYSGRPYYLTSDPVEINFDQGNAPITTQELLTAEGKFQRIVHRSLDHLFYRNYKDNNKGTFGGGNINFQKRTLNDKAFVLSLPQKKYGEEIQQGSVVVNIKRSGDFYSGNYTLVDDLYGNLYISNSIAGSPVSSSNIVGRFHFDQGYKYFAKGSITIEDNYTDGYWPMKATYHNVIFSNIKSPKEDLGACLYFTGSNSSALIISSGPVANFNQSYNFENSNFSIFFTIKPEYPTVNYEFASLVAKEGPAEDLFIDINGNVGTSPAGTNYPYKVKLGVSGSNLGKLYFGRSSGFQTSEIDTGSTTLSAGTKYDIAVIKDGANMKIYVDGFLRASGVDTTTTGTYQAKECSNQANVYVGIQYNSGSAYNGYFDNLKFYNKALIQSELDYLKNTQGVGDVYVGNVFYKHGMIVITDPLVTESDILTTSCRGTQTIYETEVSCTIGGGEFNHSSNPTLQEYDPVSDEFIFRPFVSSSDFKPYITTIGLYDDRGNLLVIGKLGQPIKTPDNTDTTFIVRFDR